MTKLIEHLADLTSFRDREQLDVALVRAVDDVLRPLSVTLYRCVGEPDDLRWITRARRAAGVGLPLGDPLWRDVNELPRLCEAPVRLECLKTASVTVQGQAPQLTAFPIATEREVVGVLELESAAPLDAAHKTLVTTVLRLFGNFHDLLDHSERDALTGLLNRQTFDSAFASRLCAIADGSQGPDGAAPEQRRIQAQATAPWLGVIDIDHFKRVNDGFGHLIGDEVLLLMARLLRSTFRHHDRLYRFGGEEFVVVLECNSDHEAAMIFERVRTRVAAFSFPQVGAMSVSIGHTQCRLHETPSAAFSRADKALYFAKDNGRNQVVSFEALLRSGVAVDHTQAGGVELF